MPENTLDDQDINVFIVKVRSHTVPQGMAGNVKGRMEVGLKQYFFQIIFHLSSCGPFTLTGSVSSSFLAKLQKALTLMVSSIFKAISVLVRRPSMPKSMMMMRFLSAKTS